MTEQEQRELGLRAAKLFGGERQHARDATGGPNDGKCGQCDKPYTYDTGGRWTEPAGECVLQPIVINWDNAMGLRDAIMSCKSRNHWDEALREVHVMAKRPAGYSDVDQWFVDLATPADYILAACEAKEGE